MFGMKLAELRIGPRARHHACPSLRGATFDILDDFAHFTGGEHAFFDQQFAHRNLELAVLSQRVVVIDLWRMPVARSVCLIVRVAHGVITGSSQCS